MLREMGKKEWTLEEFGNKYREELIDYLNSKSKSNPNISVWTELCFQWNMMKGFEIEDIDEYIRQECDKRYANNPDYVAYNLDVPDYMNLRNRRN